MCIRDSALNDSSLWEKKKIKKKDEKTGEEIAVEDYDWDKITINLSKPSSSYTLIISTAIIASSTNKPKEIINAPKETLCKSIPKASIATGDC